MDVTIPAALEVGEHLQDTAAAVGSNDGHTAESGIRGVSHPRLKRLFQYLELHPSHRISTEAAAKLACLQTNYFCTLFRREMGCTFVSWQRAWRIARIVELILSADVSITLAAERYGYVHMRSFERAFKSIYQVSAREFRREFGASSAHKETARRRRRS